MRIHKFIIELVWSEWVISKAQRVEFYKTSAKTLVVDVLRVAAEIRPSAIPFILFKALFRYPLYLIALLLFVRNIRDLFELFLYRDRVKELEFRFAPESIS